MPFINIRLTREGATQEQKARLIEGVTDLVTTVQGLVAAIPLILAHSLLQSRFTELSNVLEQQVAGILAERAESNGDRVERVA